MSRRRERAKSTVITASEIIRLLRPGVISRVNGERRHASPPHLVYITQRRIPTRRYLTCACSLRQLHLAQNNVGPNTEQERNDAQHFPRSKSHLLYEAQNCRKMHNLEMETLDINTQRYERFYRAIRYAMPNFYLAFRE